MPARAAGLVRAAIAVLVVAVATAAVGQDRSPVLTLDPERLFEETLFGQRVIAEAEAEAEALQAENRRIEAELTAEERALTERRPDLPVDEFRALADAFDEKVDRFRTEQDRKAREVSRLRDEGQQRFFQRVGAVLNALVEDRGAAVLLDRRGVILAVEAVDVTDAAIARIDAELGDGRGGDAE